MTAVRSTTRTTAVAVAVVAASTVLAATVTAAATPSEAVTRPDAPSTAARAAGVTPQGGAFMGWSHRGTAPTAATSGTGDTAGTPAAAPSSTTATTDGIDVSHYQGTVNWASYYGSGNRFAYIKATEGTSFKDDHFNSNYTNSYNAGFIRGAYHFARPDVSSGATQATYFASNGGGWSADGKTLPGALDIEYNPYGATCYGKSASSMVSWISDFSTTYHSKTGRWPVIYTTFDWWSTCTGNSSAFSANSPFWIARYNSTIGSIPAGASTWTIWQYTSSPLDKNRFNGDLTRVTALALG